MKKYYLLIFSFLLFLSACKNNSDKGKIEASGTIEATNVILSSKVSGEISKIYFDEGDKIEKGDTICVIDNEAYYLQFLQADLQLKQADLQYRLMNKGSRNEDIRRAEEYLTQCRVQQEAAKRDLDRMRELYLANSISKSQFENYETLYEIKTAQLKSAEEDLKKIKNIFRPEEIQQAKINLEKADVNRKTTLKNMKDCYIISPMDGHLVKKYIEIGETVAPMTSLVKISYLEKVKLTIYISLNELNRIQLGKKVKIKIDGSEKEFEGKVIFISNEAEFTPKNIQTKDERVKQVYAVKIEIDNPNLELKVGMPADAIIE